MSNAYAIGHVTIKNEAIWAEYRSKLPATLEPWGGELMFRGKLKSVFSGSHAHEDTVVIRFPSREALEGWHESPEYQALIPLRNKAADVDLLGFEE
jgi:uncharacterized protein (DUF1330 family)